MRRYWWLISLGLLAAGSELAQAQAPACQLMRTGTFVVDDSLASGTIIHRMKNTQTEINEQAGLEFHYKVRWLDACTYQLHHKKMVRGPERFAGKKGQTLTVHITAVSSNGYQAIASSNFSSLVLPVRLKKYQPATTH